MKRAVVYQWCQAVRALSVLSLTHDLSLITYHFMQLLTTTKTVALLCRADDLQETAGRSPRDSRLRQ